jgi:WD40 repeat protein
MSPVFFLLAAALPSFAQGVSFSSQIKPILAKQCSGCHQPQSMQSGLSVATFESLQKGGSKGPGFVAGKPDESLLIGYLTGAKSPRMPFGGKPLPEDQIELFRTWIREGAENDSGGAATPANNEPKVPVEPVTYRSTPLVTAFTFSPDGKTLAVSGYHEILLNSVEGKLVARLPGKSKRIHGLAFTPDGKTLTAVGGDPSLYGEV